MKLNPDETYSDPYLDAFNRHFNFHFKLKPIENEKFLSFHIGTFCGQEFAVWYSIYGFQESPLVLKFQLIKYFHHPGSYYSPPETDDVVIGNFDSLQFALREFMRVEIESELDNLLQLVSVESDLIKILDNEGAL